MKSTWETYKGKRIFYCRYDHLTLSEGREEVPLAEKEIFSQPKSSVLLMVGTAGTILSPDAINLYKNTALACKPYARKIAILGMTGARKVILDFVTKFAGVNVASFDTESEAFEWLVRP
jgi:hypothetical protein